MRTPSAPKLPISSQITVTAISEATVERRKQRSDRWRAPKTASKSEVKLFDQFSSLWAPISQSAISSLRSWLSRPPASSVRASIEPASPAAQPQLVCRKA